MRASAYLVRLLALAVVVGIGPTVRPARAQIDPDAKQAVETSVVQLSSLIVQLEKGKDAETLSVPLGSGVFVSADGFILTNYHVIDQGPLLATIPGTEKAFRSQGRDVTLDVQQGHYLVSIGENDGPPIPRFTAEVVNRDPALDFAVLRVTGTADGEPLHHPDPFPFVMFGDSGVVSTGDAIYVFGYPSNTSSLTFTLGTISSFEVDGDQQRIWMNSDVNVAAGSSGGAAVDELGRLVGIPTLITPPRCEKGDTNGDGLVDEADIGCVPVGGFLAKLRPVNMAKPILGRVALEHHDYAEKSLNVHIVQDEVVCLTTGTILVTNIDPPFELPDREDRGTAICWVGPQYASAENLTGYSSYKRYQILSGDPKEAALELVRGWGLEMTTNPDGCGSYGPCDYVDLVVIHPDHSVHLDRVV